MFLRCSPNRIAVMIREVIIACLALFLWPSFCSAQADDVKALLIGDDDYHSGQGFDSLGGVPLKDVNAVKMELMKAGFVGENITIATNLSYDAMVQQLENFQAQLKATDAAILYFSGHGFSQDETDYLAPVDARIDRLRDPRKAHVMTVRQVVSYLKNAKIQAVVLDACRLDLKQLKSATSSGHVISNLQQNQSGRGELLAYAASPGQAALVSSPGGLSSYTYYLTQSFDTRPKTLYGALRLARESSWNAQHDDRYLPQIVDNTIGEFPLPAFDRDLETATPTASETNRTSITQPVVTKPSEPREPRCPSPGSLAVGWSLTFPTTEPTNAQVGGYLFSYILKDFDKNLATVDMDSSLKGTMTMRNSVTGLTAKSPLLPGTEKMAHEVLRSIPLPGDRIVQGEMVPTHTGAFSIRRILRAETPIEVHYSVYSDLDIQIENPTLPLRLDNLTSASRSAIAILDEQAQKDADAQCKLALRTVRGYDQLNAKISALVKKLDSADVYFTSPMMVVANPSDIEAAVKRRSDAYDDLQPELDKTRKAVARFLKWNSEEIRKDSGAFDESDRLVRQNLVVGYVSAKRPPAALSTMIDYLNNLSWLISVPTP